MNGFLQLIGIYAVVLLVPGTIWFLCYPVEFVNEMNFSVYLPTERCFYLSHSFTGQVILVGCLPCYGIWHSN